MKNNLTRGLTVQNLAADHERAHHGLTHPDMPQIVPADWRFIEGLLEAKHCQDAAVSLGRYADRFDPSTYENDNDTVGIFESTADDPDSLWLSGRLFHRLTGVAVSYEMHTLALLADVDSDRLNRARCESLLDELAFVADRLNDPLAVRTAQTITDFIGQRLRQPRWNGSITFEGD